MYVCVCACEHVIAGKACSQVLTGYLSSVAGEGPVLSGQSESHETPIASYNLLIL